MAGLDRDEIAKLEALYSANPEGRIFTHLAEAYRKAGEVGRARELVERGLERHPEYSSAHVVLGRILLDQGDLSAAEDAFGHVLELDPENRVALRSLAEIAATSGRLADAASYYRELLLLDPADEAAAEALREVLAAGGDIGDPIADLAPEPGEAEPESSLDWAISLEGAGPEPFDMDLLPADTLPALPIESIDLDIGAPVAEIDVGDGSAELPGFEPLDLDSFDWAEPEPIDLAEAAVPEVEDDPLAEFRDDAFEEVVAEPGHEEMDAAIAEEDDPLADWRFDDESIAAAASAGEVSDSGGELPVDEPVAGTTSSIDEEFVLPAEVSQDFDVLETETFEDDDFGSISLVTETMGDLYASQGLLAQALQVYRELLESRPGDAGLLGKIEELERTLASGGARVAGEEVAIEQEVAEAESSAESSSFYETTPGGAEPVEPRLAASDAAPVAGTGRTIGAYLTALLSYGMEVAAAPAAGQGGEQAPGGEGETGFYVEPFDTGVVMDPGAEATPSAAAIDTEPLPLLGEADLDAETEPLLLDASMVVEEEPVVDVDPLVEPAAEAEGEEILLLDESMVVEEEAGAEILVLDESMVVEEGEEGELGTGRATPQGADSATPLDDDDLEVFHEWLRNLKR